MKREGFSLLEVVVSMLIFSIVIAGNTSLMVTANKIIANSRHRLQAVNRAQAVLERLRFFVSAEPNNPSGLNTTTNLLSQSPAQIGMGQTPGMSGVSFESWSYDVSPAGSNLKEVTVNLNWSEA